MDIQHRVYSQGFKSKLRFIVGLEGLFKAIAGPHSQLLIQEGWTEAFKFAFENSMLLRYQSVDEALETAGQGR